MGVLRTNWSPSGEPAGGRLTTAIYGIDMNEHAQLINTHETALGLLGESGALNSGSNKAPNSQFEIMSGLNCSTRWNKGGTGTLSPANMLSNTAGANTAGNNSSVLTLDSVPAEWKVDDLIKLNTIGGKTAQAALTDFPLRIANISGNTITVWCPRGSYPTATGTANVEPVNVGGAASVGTGDAADGWSKSTSLMVWREDNAENLQAGAYYALACRKTVGSVEYVYINMGAPDVRQYAGRTVVFGCWIKQKVRSGSGTWQVFVSSNGTGGTTTLSSAGTTSSAYQWLEVTATIPADATTFSAGLSTAGAIGDVYYLCNPVLAFGTSIGSLGYVKPRETFIPIVKVEPLPWINATVTFPAVDVRSFFYWWHDFYADTSGQVAPTVKLAYGAVEGINTGTAVTGIGGHRLIGWGDDIDDPLRLGPFMAQVVTNVKCYAHHRLPLKNGWGIVFSGVASDVWSNVSIDLDVFELS